MATAPSTSKKKAPSGAAQSSAKTSASEKSSAKKPAEAKAAAPKKAVAAVAKKPAAPKKAVAAVAKKPAAPKKPVAKRTTAAKSTVTPEQRYCMVAEAAYYHAERQGFMGDPVQNWITAEAEIAALLSKK